MLPAGSPEDITVRREGIASFHKKIWFLLECESRDPLKGWVGFARAFIIFCNLRTLEIIMPSQMISR
jgi:hypothetical protein